MISRNSIRIGGGIVAIGFVAWFVYWGILYPPAAESLYPWASDTLGHVLKVDYLLDNLNQGILYPDILPDWYMGQQMMRYHPPLPYYLLVLLSAFLPGSITAANWFVVLCALVGGLSWLLYRRWIGLLPAVLGAILFLFLPDNLRVAFAEGNLPRVLATALMPLLVYFLLRSLENTGRIWHRLGLALCFALVVLSHAMMAAIYAVFCTLLVIVLWLRRTTSLRQAAQVVLFIVLGITLSGWWLLPSFSGGITELDTSAMTEALSAFPLTDYLNPAQRTGNPEAVYIGLALLALSVASLWVYREQRGYTIALTFTGCFGVLITTSGINDIFNALPFHNLLWPLRFLGIASFALLLALMWSLRGWQRISPFFAFGVVLVLALDSAGSFSLINLRPMQTDVVRISQELSASQGWRVATLDLSRLGSAPSYAFSAIGSREQIFGWAYQGARTAKTVAALNEAIEMGFPAYLLDRLNLYGVDDVVLLNEIPGAHRISSLLLEEGYTRAYSGEQADLYHRAGFPRAFLADWRALGIGRGAPNLAYLFPSLVVGTSTHVDDYNLDELSRFETLVLSGFQWHDRTQSEELIRQVAQRGVRVVIDLTGVEEDPLARIPRFLDVWGEQVILSHQPIKVFGYQQEYTLQPFSNDGRLWYTHMLQGLEKEFLSFDYLGEDANLVGYNSYGAGQVWFVGLNLPYHAVTTHDPLAIQLLSVLLGLPPHQISDYSSVFLARYKADQQGYRFAYHLDSPEVLFVPIAFHDGMIVFVDGNPVEVHSYERLMAFKAPAGAHSVEIKMGSTPIYLLGKAISGFSILGLVAVVLLMKRYQW